MIRLKVVHVDHVAKVAEKLGTLATVAVLDGSLHELSPGEFEDTAGLGRWRLTSVAHSDPGNGSTFAVAFKGQAGEAELAAGMELRPVETK